MSRMPRIQVENAIYLVTPRGDNDEPIFKDAADYATYSELLSRYKKAHNFKLYAFCLLPNSVNLLIEPSGIVTISQIMHDLSGNYTKYFNRRYKRSGHLFQERYHVALIEKEPNLLKMTAYIHLMPALQEQPSDIIGYQYSSYTAYLAIAEKVESLALNATHIKELDISDEITETLGYLKAGTYHEYVGAMAVDEAPQIAKDLAKKTVIGSDEFVRGIKSRIESEKHKSEEGPQPAPQPKQDLQPTPESIPALEPQPAPEPQPEPQPEPAPEPKTETKSEPPSGHKLNISKIILDVVLGIIAVATLALFIHAKAAQVKERLDQALARKEAELQDALVKERQAVSKDLGEKLQAEKASFEAEVSRLESEKEKAEEELLKEKLASAGEVWLGSAREKLASLKDKLIRPARHALPEFPEPYDLCYLRGYYFREKNMDPRAGCVNIEENLYIEKIQMPDTSDIADLSYTVSTPIKLNFEYREGKFLYKNEEYGGPSVREGWPGL